MPYFPGQWFPKRDFSNTNRLFEACMLALLTPWRSIADIKAETESFCDAYNSFLSSAPEHVLSTIHNIEFYHECAERASLRHEQDNEAIADIGEEIDDIPQPHNFNATEIENNDADMDNFETVILEEDIT
ncbi:hypothetical protein EI94DRAFT_1807895 [Lactarius quietus]|nr:hypothetical protein EI94DRAFT_1807895 [Lactarius quietus]